MRRPIQYLKGWERMKRAMLVMGLLGLGFGGSAFADDSLSSALRGCINQSILENQLYMSKTAVDGTSDSTLTIGCTGAEAEALFTAIDRYSNEDQKRWSDGSIVISRFFGNLNIPSQCHRKIRDSRGYETNSFWCNIQLDIVSSAIKALNL